MNEPKLYRPETLAEMSKLMQSADYGEVYMKMPTGQIVALGYGRCVTIDTSLPPTILPHEYEAPRCTLTIQCMMARRDPTPKDTRP